MNLDKGIDLIKSFEGLRLNSYQDSVGIWTIGYGTTVINGEKVREGMTITEEEAEELLFKHCVYLEQKILGNIQPEISVNDNEVSALLSFAYNLGLGSLFKSTLFKLLNADHDRQEIAQEFLRWTKAGGEVLPGLVRRRQAESELFLSKEA